MTDQASRRDIAALINAQILAARDQGVMPWRKPWDSARTHVALPRRITGEAYRGVNTIMLWLAAVAHGYRSPLWITFNQATKLGAHVRRGERGQIVVYYGAATRQRIGDDGAPIEDKLRFLKSYVVFNADQVEGLSADLSAPPAPATLSPGAAHEQWFAKLGIARMLSRDLACYIPSRDVIAMPPVAAFDSADAYAATLNHECVHATSAAHRVGRDLGRRFEREAYAAEELIAEIGAAILGAHLGMAPGHITNHAAYIQSWMKLLADDRRAFLYAAAQAQLAVDWLLDKSPVSETTHVPA